MFCNISCESVDVKESLNTLQFATRVRSIELGEAKKHHSDANNGNILCSATNQTQLDTMKTQCKQFKREVESKNTEIMELKGIDRSPKKKENNDMATSNNNSHSANNLANAANLSEQKKLSQVTKENQALEKKLNNTNTLVNKLKLENQELKSKLIQNKIVSANSQRPRTIRKSPTNAVTDKSIHHTQRKNPNDSKQTKTKLGQTKTFLENEIKEKEKSKDSEDITEEHVHSDTESTKDEHNDSFDNINQIKNIEGNTKRVTFCDQPKILFPTTDDSFVQFWVSLSLFFNIGSLAFLKLSPSVVRVYSFAQAKKNGTKKKVISSK
ncbi:kinesin motor protein [Reticulomyxa filosa]|uniref:Kinesin motor protein n=1 Tax=Reticulomyxa filosa TaxID=46433 RepID=X6NCY3_RETFI|nr:kinesin motor protein [Reticulomyxa filosa]|eukprot:ETO24185.1 kinesin motor protein [Reticulomyxa filosa]